MDITTQRWLPFVHDQYLRNKSNSLKHESFMMPMVTPEVKVMTTFGASNDDNVGIMTTLGFPWEATVAYRYNLYEWRWATFVGTLSDIW